MTQLTLRTFAPSALLLALAVTSAGRADALTCELPEIAAPAPDSVHVPTNTLV